MRRSMPGLALLAATAASVPSCGKGQAGFFVVVDADPMMRIAGRRLHVRIYNPYTSQTPLVEREIEVLALQGDTNGGYPVSFTVEATNVTDHIRVEVDVPTMPTPLTLRASGTFEEGHMLVLPMLALGACVNHSCATSQTCTQTRMGPACITAEAARLEYSEGVDTPCDRMQVRSGRSCVQLIAP